jgi:hypothetical protein
MPRSVTRVVISWSSCLALLLSLALCTEAVFAQAPPAYTLTNLISSSRALLSTLIPFLAQILTGATYTDQIPDAAKWAHEHHYLTGQGRTSPMPSPPTNSPGTPASKHFSPSLRFWA